MVIALSVCIYRQGYESRAPHLARRGRSGVERKREARWNRQVHGCVCCDRLRILLRARAELSFFAILAKGGREVFYHPRVCNWTRPLQSSRVVTKNNESPWIEDFIVREH